MTEDSQHDPSRRGFIRGALAASAAAAVASSAPTSHPLVAAPQPARPLHLVRQENRKPGSLDWQLSKVRTDAGGIRSPWIEGYCARQSVEPGDTLDIMVSTNPARRFTLEVFRMGHYGGRGARLMTVVGPVAGKTQPDPPVGERRLRECRWEPAVQLKIGADWPSGVYLGRLSCGPQAVHEHGWQSYVIFIVRQPRGQRPADILVQCSDNTWQAYNRWPSTFSLYDTDTQPWSLGDESDISFDRPYGKYRQIIDAPQSVGSGEFLLWEFPLCHWLEQHGYDVAYCSNSDMTSYDTDGPLPKVFISVGHDEYWDERQYHTVKRMIDAGVNVLFLCGNSVCFVSPFRDSSTGVPNRIIRRQGAFGGMTAKEKARMGPFQYTGPNERDLIGARTIIPFNGGGDWIVTKPDHWLFHDTGMKKGDRIPGLVGWEFHGDPIDTAEVVAEGIALAGGREPAHWTATVYPGPRDNFVFNAATIYWSQGLSSPPGHMLPWSHWTRPHGPDARVQQITHNALRRALLV